MGIKRLGFGALAAMVLVGLTVVCLSTACFSTVCAADEKEKPKPSPTAPVTTKAPREIKAEEEPEPADNSYCLVCHTNYEEEKLTKVHLPAGIGCEKCHGMSDEHSADEDALTPPEIMYTKKKIDPFCMECHPKDEIDKEENHEEYFEDPDPDEHCTECHAEKHRLKVRTRIWDKKTGKLISDDGVRMMYKNSPASNAK